MKRIPIPPKPDLCRMYITEHKSSYGIAEIIGCSSETVRRWLHEYKISVRTAGRPHGSPKTLSPINEILKHPKEILEERVTNVPTKETEYMEYLETPRTTKELMTHFGAKKHAVWQVMRTLRLDGIAHHTWNGFWKITEDGDDVSSIPLTALQAKYIEYLCTAHTTNEMCKHFDKKMEAVQQLVRTLRRQGHVESVGRGSQSGKGGCWNIYRATEKGLEAI